MAMWLLAAALLSGLKIWIWPAPVPPSWRYWLWPGLDPAPFRRPLLARPVRAAEWGWAAAKTLLGALLLWVVARYAAPPLLAAWIGMAGLIFLLHFGTFHLWALAWRARGFPVEPLMAHPWKAQSLGEFWGRRWNRAFADAARLKVLRPLAPRLGLPGATLAAYGFSGLLHELVITVPAGGGYGLPTGYFLLQGAVALWQRAHRRWSEGARGRLVTLACVIGPACGLFPPVWIERVMRPFLHDIHAL